MAAKAFCVLVFHVLRCSALFHLLHPARFQMPISDKNAQLYYCSDVGMRSFTLYTSSLCLLSRLHRDTPERACPAQWELYRKKKSDLSQLLSNQRCSSLTLSK